MKKKAKKIKEDLSAIEEKGKRLESLIHLSHAIREKERRVPITFNDFLYNMSQRPECVLRDIFQLFYDMVHHYVPEGQDDYKVTEDSIGFKKYDFSKLFVNQCDSPFFIDRLFANRFMNLADGFRKGNQKNNIFLFEGPPGSGKSTFLNNLLNQLEEYAKTPEGTTYKIYWKLDIEELGGFQRFQERHPEPFEEMKKTIGKQNGFTTEPNSDRPNGNHHNGQNENRPMSMMNGPIQFHDKHLEFSCPNHDHPILLIPKSYRKQFLDELIPDKRFKEKLFNDKEYEWVLKDIPCNICNSLYKALLDETSDPMVVFSMVYARQNFFSRQLGEGISVFNPGDRLRNHVISNPTIERLLSILFKNDDIKFMYSYLAKTNNGVLALMDIKEQNAERLKNFHGIISDGVHKVELAEEHINTLFLGLVNPTDKKHYMSIPSFKDRIISVNVAYILDFMTEVEIYRNKFGEKVEARFLPHILENFAKIIISSRLNNESQALKKWIPRPEKYKKFVDKNMLLLKMDIYTGKVPSWLSEEDLKLFDRKTRKSVIDESHNEGAKGISGRQSLNVFSEFLTKYPKKEQLITMDMLKKFFEKGKKNENISQEFLDSLEVLYDYNVLQEVKESIYYYNKEQLSKDIQNYLFAINYDPGVNKTCDYTGDKIEISEEYFNTFESIVLGASSTAAQKKIFRKDTHNEYVRKTLYQEIGLDGKKITETEQYKSLFKKYTRNLKEHALAPHVENNNFRLAIKDFGASSFKTYGERLRRDVKLLITNLVKDFKYSEEGAKQICYYVLDKKLTEKY